MTTRRYTTAPLYDRDEDPAVARSVGVLWIVYASDAVLDHALRASVSITITDYLAPWEFRPPAPPVIYTS